ncbi:hypothetical protein SKPI104516_16310 [Skermania piniformis]
MAGSKCNKCSRPLLDCQGCKGGRATSNVFGALTCSRCTKGQVCAEHGKHWE